MKGDFMNIEKICVDIAEKYNIDTIGLFGSRARGDFYRESDYDIFIIWNIDLNTELEIEADLEKLIGMEVDLVKLTESTDRIFVKNVLNEGIVYFNRNNAYEKIYSFIENFFIENSDFIKLRDRDLLD